MSLLQNHNRFVRKAEHPDASYIKQEGIGVVISKALADLYLANPDNPLEFLGTWLLNYAKLNEDRQKNQERAEEQDALKEKFRQLSKAQEEDAAVQEQMKKARATQEEAFKSKIAGSFDLQDYLSEFAGHLCLHAHATACYVGVHEKVKKPVGPLDDDNAHEDPEAPMVVRYIAASPGSELMLGQSLSEEEGKATYALWEDEEVPEGRAHEEEEEDVEVEELPPKSVFVPDVVNDTRIKFFEVPRLGSYLAVQLTYDSCLNEPSYDAAVANAADCRRQRAEQEAIKLAEEEHEEFPEIHEDPYVTQPVSYVICMDTLGQDRVFSQEEIKYAVDWAWFYKRQWERAEAQCMRELISSHLDQQEADAQMISEKETDWAEEEKNASDGAVKDLDSSTIEDAKQNVMQRALFEIYKQRLNSSEVMSNLMRFKDYPLVKFAKVFQVAFYYTGVKREMVVEPGTNKVNWKIAKLNLNDKFKDALEVLNVFGPKSQPVEEYAKTMRLQAELAKVNIEEVKAYSYALFMLYTVLEMAFQLRVQDVTQRRNEFLTKKEERDNAIKAAEDLAERRNVAVTEAEQKFMNDSQMMEDVPQEPFDSEKFLKIFDDQNPAIEIPPAYPYDDDQDIDWEETNPSPYSKP